MLCPPSHLFRFCSISTYLLLLLLLLLRAFSRVYRQKSKLREDGFEIENSALRTEERIKSGESRVPKANP